LFGVGGAFCDGVAAVVGLVAGVVGVVVDRGGLPAAARPRATLEICGATQTIALAASPVLKVACAKSRRVN
jgi:hypothetical protein